MDSLKYTCWTTFHLMIGEQFVCKLKFDHAKYHSIKMCANIESTLANFILPNLCDMIYLL